MVKSFFKLILVMAVLFLTGCDSEVDIAPKGVLTGVVINTEGQPIEGVEITAGDKIAVTNSKGSFSISDIDVGGNPKYYITLNKQNYLAASAEASFASSLSVQDSNKIDGLPLENAAASIKVTMIELVTLKGTLKLPEGATITSGSAIKVEPEITVSDSYSQLNPKSGYKSSVSSALTFEIKDVPRAGIENSSTIISEMKFKVFINDKKYADYICSETEKSKLNLAAMIKIKGAEQNQIDIGEIDLSRLYTVTGKVYTSVEKTTPADGAYIYLKKNDTEYKKTITDSTGNFIMGEIEEGQGYSLELNGYDEDGDGTPEFYNHEKLEQFSLIGSKTTVNKELCFEGKYSYTVTGSIYAGKKELNQKCAGAKVKMFNSSGRLIAYGVSDSAGNYKFENVKTASIYITVDDKDINGNGVADFKGYTPANSATAKARVDLTNSENQTISGADLIMQVNSEENSFKLEIKTADFATVNSDGTTSEITNGVEPGDKLSITFSNKLSADSITKIESKGKKPFAIYDVTNGQYISSSYEYGKDSSNVEDKSKIVITPGEYLTSNKYRVEINALLSSEAGSIYEVGNTLSSIPFDANSEAYKLEVTYTNFASKNSIGIYVAATNLLLSDDLVIKFNYPVSNESMKAIIDAGQKVVYLNDGTAEVAAALELSKDKKTIVINPDANLRSDIEYRITVNNKLASEAGFKYGCFRMVDTSTVFSVKGTIAK
jgi:hypothetical protein